MIEFAREQIAAEFRARQKCCSEIKRQSYPCFDYSRFIEGSRRPVIFNRFNFNDLIVSDFVRELEKIKANQILTFTADDNEKLTISSVSVDGSTTTYIISNTASNMIAVVTLDAARFMTMIELRNAVSGNLLTIEDFYSILYMMNLCKESRPLTMRFINEWS